MEQSSRRDDQAPAKPPAVLLGLDSAQGLQTARILHGHEIPVIGVAGTPGHYCARTNTCQRIFAASAQAGDLLHCLETLGPRLHEKGVLIPCTDPMVLLISRNRLRLQEWFHINLPAPEVVETFADNAKFYSYARQENLPVPTTFLVDNRSDLAHASNHIPYPCLLKPPLSAASAWEQSGSLKAYRAGNADELIALYDRLEPLSERFIVQEWIRGEANCLFFSVCYFNADSEPVVVFTCRKIRQWPPRVGEACSVIEVKNDVVRDMTIRLFSQANYRGLGYLEMKRDERSGRYLIIEPNVGRPTGPGSIAEAGGTELLYTMYCDTTGAALPSGLRQQYKQTRWISLRRDCQSALYSWRQGELTPKEWWQSIRGPCSYAFWSWRDPVPFLADLLRAGFLFMSAEERKKRDYGKHLG